MDRTVYAVWQTVLVFAFTDTGWGVPHKVQSAGSIPCPSFCNAVSIFSLHFHLQDKVSFLVRCHLEIHSLSLLPFGTGGLTLLWYLWYTWCAGCHRKTGRRNWHLPILPIANRIGIFLSPFFPDLLKLWQGSCLTGGIVYRFEIRGKLLQVTVIYIFEGIAHHKMCIVHVHINAKMCIYKFNLIHIMCKYIK